MANKIQTESDYKIALKRIEALILLNPKKGSKEYDELNMIGELVALYEEIHFPIN